MRPLIYLAVPYSHLSERIEDERYENVTYLAMQIFKAGLFVFSPITHCHEMKRMGLEGTWEFWADYDRRMIDCCDALAVYQLTGWKESIGVAGEMQYAKMTGKQILMSETEEGLINLLLSKFPSISSQKPLPSLIPQDQER